MLRYHCAIVHLDHFQWAHLIIRPLTASTMYEWMNEWMNRHNAHSSESDNQNTPLFTHELRIARAHITIMFAVNIEIFFHFSPQIDVIIKQNCANFTNAIPSILFRWDWCREINSEIIHAWEKDNLLFELEGQEDQMLPVESTVELDFSLIFCRIEFWLASSNLYLFSPLLFCNMILLISTLE